MRDVFAVRFANAAAHSGLQRASRVSRALLNIVADANAMIGQQALVAAVALYEHLYAVLQHKIRVVFALRGAVRVAKPMLAWTRGAVPAQQRHIFGAANLFFDRRRSVAAHAVRDQRNVISPHDGGSC